MSDSIVDDGESTGGEIGSGVTQTLAHGVLSPRHRRFALLVAQGASGGEIKKEVGYSDSRISVLKRNPFIAAEITRLQEQIYEETVGQRLKGFADPALNVIQEALLDRTNKVKMSEKIQVAQWVIEKIDGKATQKIEAGGSLLASLLDRLDAQKTSPTHITQVNVHNYAGDAESQKDVTESAPLEISAASDAGREKAPGESEEELLDNWFVDNQDTFRR